MFQFILQTGIDKIAEEIWFLLRQHPGESVIIFILIFVSLILFFNFVINRMTPYIAILSFIIAMVLTPLILLALYEGSETSTLTSILQTLRCTLSS